MMCLRRQLENARQLDDSLAMTYEALVQDPAEACAKLAAFMPALGDMDHAGHFEVHSIDGTVKRPITDLNSKKIATLSATSLAAMNEVFMQHSETISAWGYSLMPALESP
jgi:hypothetical protein